MAQPWPHRLNRFLDNLVGHAARGRHIDAHRHGRQLPTTHCARRKLPPYRLLVRLTTRMFSCGLCTLCTCHTHVRASQRCARERQWACARVDARVQQRVANSLFHHGDGEAVSEPQALHVHLSRRLAEVVRPLAVHRGWLAGGQGLSSLGGLLGRSLSLWVQPLQTTSKHGQLHRCPRTQVVVLSNHDLSSAAHIDVCHANDGVSTHDNHDTSSCNNAAASQRTWWV